MTALYDIIRGFRTAEGEVFRVAGTESEPFAAVDPRRMRVEVAAGASLRLAVLHTSPEVSALEIVLEKGARFVLTELFVSEAFAEVTVKQAARSLCHITAVQLSSANASYTVDLDGRVPKACWAERSSPPGRSIASSGCGRTTTCPTAAATLI